MKAESAIFTGVQKPMTMLGLPAGLFMLLAAGSAASFGACIAVGAMPVALVAAVVTFAVGWVVLWRKNNADCHFGHMLFRMPTFWAGHREVRLLVAGGTPSRKKK